jgi:hypothetical protein
MNDTLQFSSLQMKLDKLRKGVNALSVNPDVQTVLQQLLWVPIKAIAEKRILKSLEFPTMFSRFDHVNDAHFKTFEWIFQDMIRDQTNSRPKVSFVEWLVNGTGIFHVSGKLGSGKSTLMKFLYQHERTKQLLNEWAGENWTLVLAQFFFWRAGEKDQKSLSGLLRALLYEVLKKCPEFIPSVFPAHWEKITSQDWRVESNEPLFKRDIRDAFKLLVRNGQLYKGRRFCFFIDGLDEYEETTEEDYKDMLDLIFSWTNAAPEEIKLCVASREYEVFRKAFSDDKRLRLQDLTRRDIETVIRERLDGFDISDQDGLSPSHKERLIKEIMKRSDGIFLWVTLVLKSLREGLHYDNRFCSLLKKVNEMPQGMEPLLQHLLDTINPSDRTIAYRTFAILQECHELGLSMSLMQYSFLEDYLANEDFAYKIDLNTLGEEWIKKVQDRPRTAIARLNGQCRGLIEDHEDKQWLLTEIGNGIGYNRRSIAFIHRSVYDFMSRPDVQSDIQKPCLEFDVVDAISHVFLTEMKFYAIACTKQLPAYILDEISDTNLMRHSYIMLGFDIHKIIRSRKSSGKDVAPPFRFLECLSLTMNQFPIPSAGSTDISWRFVLSVFHIAATHNLEYAGWKIAANSILLRDKAMAAELLKCLIQNSISSKSTAGLQFIIDRVKEGFLLDSGADSLWNMPVDRRDATAWEFMLIAALYLLPNCSMSDKRVFGEVLEIALTSGVDLRWWVKVYFTKRAVVGLRGEGTILFGDNTNKTTLKFLKERKRVEIADLVEFWQLENRAKLQELISRQTADRKPLDIEVEGL